MWTRYLAPQDLTPEQAALVLAFLNEAPDAQTIAERVEYAGELDVGLRVAQRILDRRTALGGRFDDLEQVAAVPYVGPERFTEIVAAITGYRPPGAGTADVRTEIDDLYERLAALGGAAARLHVSVRPVVRRAWLGQRTSLVVTVRHLPGDRPAPDVPVTLITTWGRLASADGFSTQRGRSVTLRTGADGTARATLLPVTDEPVRREQQVVLDAALETLDRDAATPQAVRGQLAEIARRYRVPENGHLRAAIDIYFDTYARDRLDALNAEDVFAAWPLINASVVAHVQEGAGAAPTSSVGASAVHTVAFRDWLAAWLAAYRERAAADSDLGQRLAGVLATGTRAGYVLPTSYGRIQQFVTAQRGRIGTQVGAEIAERTVRDFVGSALSDLPVGSRLEIAQGLGTVRDTIALRNGVSLVRGFDHARAGAAVASGITETDLRDALQGLGAQLADVSESLGGLRGELNAASAAIATLRTETVAGLRDDLQALRNDLDARVSLVDARLGAIDGRFTGIDTHLAEIDQGIARIDGLVVNMDARLDGFDSDFTRVDSRLGNLDASVARLDADVRATQQSVVQVDTGLAAVNQSLTRLDGEVAAKLDARTFDTFRGTVDQDLRTLTTDVNTLKLQR